MTCTCPTPACPYKLPGNYKSGVRVIGGIWKGTSIKVPPIEGLRPTSARIRETLFNWLQPCIEGANCLDLFAGSGVLSVEALSRGAAHALALDSHHQSVEAMKALRSRLGVEGLEIRLDRAERFLQKPVSNTFQIVFVDPPFELGVHRSVCMRLQESGRLSPEALVYVEAPRGEEFTPPVGWAAFRRKHAGNVEYMLFRTPAG